MAKLISPLPSLGAIILAGGQGRRMGYQQKALLRFNKLPLIDYALDKVRPYTDQIVISANEEIKTYEAYSYPVVSDLSEYYQRGPLAGIYSALLTMPEAIEFIQVLPCDTPFIPDTIALSFNNYLLNNPEKELVIASTAGKEHPVIMQCRRSIALKLKAYLDDPRLKNRVMGFIKSCDYGIIEFDDPKEFTNINDLSLLQG
jgi:molybdopterin-guanine dinucleotide biosynthesis protein A